MLATCAGCWPNDDSDFRYNDLEHLKQERLHLEEGQHFPESTAIEITAITRQLFGTPTEPRFPNVEPPVVDLVKLEQAVGILPGDATGPNLYRQHCAECHGVNGSGVGVSSLAHDPYPRDFRMGKFKFKSTPLRTPPTDQDLARTLRNGVYGTVMPAFRFLKEDELLALVDYVKYLAIRGQYERALLAEVSVLDGEPLIVSDGDGAQTPIAEQTAAQIIDAVGEDLWLDIVTRWQTADQRVTRPPPAPTAFHTTGAAHKELVSQGRDLFLKKGNCAQCHGENAAGDGTTIGFDDWTNDWLKTPGVDINDRQTWKPFLAAGARPPRRASPRNLNRGIFRGGGEDADIYRRIANGIEGTPMPASPALSTDEIWALVAYVKSLSPKYR